MAMPAGSEELDECPKVVISVAAMPAGSEQLEDCLKVVISVAAMPVGEQLEDCLKVVISVAAVPVGHPRELPSMMAIPDVSEVLEVAISWVVAKLKRYVQEPPLSVMVDHWVEVCRLGGLELPPAGVCRFSASPPSNQRLVVVAECANVPRDQVLQPDRHKQAARHVKLTCQALLLPWVE